MEQHIKDKLEIQLNLGTEKADILVVGDVHGCLHTFTAILDQHWKNDEILIQVGDLIDRGKFSGETIQFVQHLQKIHPNQVFILRGNHEQELIEYVETGFNSNWMRQRGYKTLESLSRVGLSLIETANWMKNLPLYWECERISISHAGIAPGVSNPFDPNNRDGVVWTRQSLKKLDKIQIVGHTPTRSGMPEYDSRSNSWYIDTGACFSGYLSAIKLSSQGEIIDTYSIKTHSEDI
jgi:serine/threonine protein phosphatase 1